MTGSDEEGEGWREPMHYQENINIHRAKFVKSFYEIFTDSQITDCLLQKKKKKKNISSTL